MSNIGGKKREQKEQNFSKRVGLFEGRVIAINPTAEEYKDVLNMELKEDSKVTEYISKNNEGTTILRVDFWLEDINNQDRFKVTFFLENTLRTSKDGLKKQYISNIGAASWDPNYFKGRDYRQAYIGEEDFYMFLRTWLGNLDLKDEDSTLQLDWSKLMKNNLRDLKSQIGGEFATNVIAMATVRTVEKEDGIKEYQGVFNKAFLPSYNMKYFKLVNYNNTETVKRISEKSARDLKPHEKFVVKITDPNYGCKDFYAFSEIQDYDPSNNLVASDKVIADDDGEF